MRSDALRLSHTIYSIYICHKYISLGPYIASGAEARGAATVEGVDRYAFHDGTVGLYFMGFANTQVRVGQPAHCMASVRFCALDSGFRFCVLPIASLSLDRTVGAAAAPRLYGMYDMEFGGTNVP